MHTEIGHWVCNVIRWYNIFARISWNATTNGRHLLFRSVSECVLGRCNVVQIVFRVWEAEKTTNGNVDSIQYHVYMQAGTARQLHSKK